MPQTIIEPPEKVADDFRKAFLSQDSAKFARLIHSDSVKEFRSEIGNSVRSILSLNYKAKRDNYLKQFDSPDNRIAFALYDQLFLQVSDSLRTTSVTELEKLDDRFIFEKLFFVILIPDPISLTLLRNTSSQLVETVREADDLIHLLYRERIKLPVDAGQEFTTRIEQKNGVSIISFCLTGQIVSACRKVEIPNDGQLQRISLKKEDGNWRRLLSQEIFSKVKEWETTITDSVNTYKNQFDRILTMYLAETKHKEKTSTGKPKRRVRKQ